VSVQSVSIEQIRLPPPSREGSAETSARIAPPGDAGIWVLITADVFLFAVFFNIFIWDRLHQAQLFEASRKLLNPDVGLLSTFFLLTSSWFMVGAVHAAREAKRRSLLRSLILAMVAGSGFAISKIFEYSHKIAAGITLVTNDFFQYYFILTGFHFFHFILGMGVLAALWAKAKNDDLDEKFLLWIESGASYWHMVDLLWLMLFPLLYLLRA
jgi:nitric oxide reductase NorE protein